MKKPILIGIGSSYSGAGKTFLASAILRYFTAKTNNSICGMKWGAVKYTRTRALPEIITDRSVLMQQGKDTWQMLTSGASKVIWVRSARNGLAEALPQALRHLRKADAVIIEGNSAIEFLKPDIVIFILGKCRRKWKSATEKHLSAADFVLCEAGTEVPPGISTGRVFHRGISDRKFLMALTQEINERRTETGDAEQVC